MRACCGDGAIRGSMGTTYIDLGQGVARTAAAAAVCLLVANCASSDKFAKRVDPKYGVSSSPRVVDFNEAVPKGGGTYRVGKPYVVSGKTYTPEEDPTYRAEGLASWYGDDFHGRLTANGEVFDMTSLTAAHPTMPLPSYAIAGRITATASSMFLTMLPHCSTFVRTASAACASSMSAAHRLKARTIES